jgi:hypothetical protein
MAALYAVSAIANIGGAALLFGSMMGWFGTASATATATGVGIALVVIGIVVVFIIALCSDDAIEAWLGKCVFGTYAKENQYHSLDEELSGLKAIQA